MLYRSANLVTFYFQEFLSRRVPLWLERPVNLTLLITPSQDGRQTIKIILPEFEPLK